MKNASPADGISRRDMLVSSGCAGIAATLGGTTQAQTAMAAGIRALTFDVYGSCTDYRGTIVREGAAINRRKRANIDWGKFADDWHDRYQPKFDAVLHDQSPWRSCTAIRREALDDLVHSQGLSDFSKGDLDALNGVWERVEPWPDTVPALLRLKGDSFWQRCPMQIWAQWSIWHEIAHCPGMSF